MSYRGYKFSESDHRPSAEILKMEIGESLLQFQKRCRDSGFECADNRAIIDQYKHLSEEVILADLESRRFPNLFLMTCNLVSDLNLAVILRSSLNFGCKKVYIYGDKKYNRKGAINAHNHLNLNHVKDLDDFNLIKNDFDKIVCLENCEGSTSINNYKWDYNKRILIIVGNEGLGICSEFLEMSDDIVAISSFASNRSINVSCAASIALYDYHLKMNLNV